MKLAFATPEFTMQHGDIIYLDMILQRAHPKVPQMQIVSHCQHRALLLLQIAKERPEFREQAFYLAHELLDGCLADSLLGSEREDRKRRPRQLGRASVSGLSSLRACVAKQIRQLADV
jgi:sulfur transfer protein SufE